MLEQIKNILPFLCNILLLYFLAVSGPLKGAYTPNIYTVGP